MEIRTVSNRERRVFAKLEYMNPSGSGKDRFVYPLLSLIKRRGINKVVEMTSGNTGISLAYYGKKLGIKTKIYIKKESSNIKKTMITLLSDEAKEVEKDDVSILREDIKDGYYPCFSICKLYKFFESLLIHGKRAYISD